ncbi:unnamed protein product [Prorocentrum cordatum]|uniref:Uncharacterized protein n=1 Tax=Prorocentrum cordatum TaxID=2364126 RepID=A0ABN9UTR9_9DINO|nr:unnamed protein product [Polarella glacialis]
MGRAGPQHGDQRSADAALELAPAVDLSDDEGGRLVATHSQAGSLAGSTAASASSGASASHFRQGGCLPGALQKPQAKPQDRPLADVPAKRAKLTRWSPAAATGSTSWP